MGQQLCHTQIFYDVPWLFEFCFFVAVWIRKGTLAILVYFSYIMFIEPVIRAIHLYYFNNRSTLFYPMNVVEDLMPNPFLSCLMYGWKRNGASKSCFPIPKLWVFCFVHCTFYFIVVVDFMKKTFDSRILSFTI